MAIRTGHGNGAGQPRVEVLPPDEQPKAQTVGSDPLATGRDSSGTGPPVGRCVNPDWQRSRAREVWSPYPPNLKGP